MSQPHVSKGLGGDHLAVVYFRDLTNGRGLLFDVEVDTGEGYYDVETDDFGSEAVAIVDDIAMEYAIRIHEQLNGIRFYRGHDAVVECNRNAVVACIQKVIDGNPYEELLSEE